MTPWKPTWRTTYLDMVAICAAAPSAAHRVFAMKLMATECTRRLISIDIGYAGVHQDGSGEPWNWPFRDLKITKNLKLEDIIEGRPLGGMTDVGPRDARRYLYAPNRTTYRTLIVRGPGPSYTLDDVLEEAAQLRTLAIADMGAEAFSAARAEWKAQLLAVRGPAVASRFG